VECEIGCNLDLADERKHIRGKPVIEQDFRFNLDRPRLCQIAERLFNIWRKAGTDSWYMERDTDGDLLWWNYSQ
jgi:hypothetical protein